MPAAAVRSVRGIAQMDPSLDGKWWVAAAAAAAQAGSIRPRIYPSLGGFFYNLTAGVGASAEEWFQRAAAALGYRLLSEGVRASRGRCCRLATREPMLAQNAAPLAGARC